MDMDIRELSPEEIEQMAEQMAEQVSELLVKPLQEAMQDALDKITAEIKAIHERMAAIEEARGLGNLEMDEANEEDETSVKARMNGIANRAVKRFHFSLIDRENPNRDQAPPTGPVDSPEMSDHYFGAKKGAAETRAKFAAAEAAREAAEQAERQRIRDGVAGMFDASIAR